MSQLSKYFENFPATHFNHSALVIFPSVCDNSTTTVNSRCFLRLSFGSKHNSRKLRAYGDWNGNVIWWWVGEWVVGRKDHDDSKHKKHIKNQKLGKANEKDRLLKRIINGYCQWLLIKWERRQEEKRKSFQRFFIFRLWKDFPGAGLKSSSAEDSSG